jgi:hypothetical protein
MPDHGIIRIALIAVLTASTQTIISAAAMRVVRSDNIPTLHTCSHKTEPTILLTFSLSLCLFSRNLENLSLVEWLFSRDILGGDGLLEDSFFLWKKSETAWIILLRRSRSLDFFFTSFAPSLCVKDTLTSGSKWKDVFGGKNVTL